MPWPQPGQKGVDLTPGLRYFSIARTIKNPHSRYQEIRQA
jgi:hypothetical protein